MGPDFSVRANSRAEALHKINHPGQLYLSCVFFDTVKQEVIDENGRRHEVYVRTGDRVFTFRKTI